MCVCVRSLARFVLIARDAPPSDAEPFEVDAFLPSSLSCSSHSCRRMAGGGEGSRRIPGARSRTRGTAEGGREMVAIPICYGIRVHVMVAGGRPSFGCGVIIMRSAGGGGERELIGVCVGGEEGQRGLRSTRGQFHLR
ncbi:hypothetical protein GW17_00019287 [Ensete ventricosum]|nr:hypothetical protein GW17_00019287 [Ensete ventricosum]